MKLRLPSLSALRAFEAAARLNSFKDAAAELSVTATAISHQIRALEENLSCALFIRKTRSVELTVEGEQLYAATREGFLCISTAVEKLKKRQRQVVTLSATPAFTAKWLVPRMAAFQAAHPDIDLHVHASYELADLHGPQIDLAIRYGQGRYTDVHSRLLLQDHFAPVASKLLKIDHYADLAHYSLIHFAWHTTPIVDLSWAAWAKEAGLHDLDLHAGSHFSEESHAIQAAIAGQGIALLSLELVRSEIDMGLLEVKLAPQLTGLAYYLVRSARKPASVLVNQVEQWLIDSAL